MTLPQNLDTPGQPLAFINGRIILREKVIEAKALLIAGQKIQAVVSMDELGSDTHIFDAQGSWIAPGLVDIHIHGAEGFSFDDPEYTAYETITQATLKHGITSLLVALTPQPVHDMIACLDICQKWMGQTHPGSQVMGVYLEGPFLNPAQKGALEADCLLLPGDPKGEGLFDYLDIIRVMVLAPELPGGLDLISRLTAGGVTPAAGHSNARDDQVLAGMKSGLRHVTHLWSAMSSTIREGPWRRPGLVEFSLTFDGLMVEIIGDYKHLPDTLMRLAYKCIGPDRLCLVSDACPGAGLPEGAHYHIGRLEYEVLDGVGMVPDHSAFAGSTTFLGQMVPLLVNQMHLSPVEVIRMAAYNPARSIAWDQQKGSIEPGKDADLVLFDADWKVSRVMVAGQWK